MASMYTGMCTLTACSLQCWWLLRFSSVGDYVVIIIKACYSI